MHFTVSCSSLLRKLLLSNSTNGCCIIRLDQQVVFLEKFRCPDTKKFLLREKNTQKTFYWEKYFGLCYGEFNASCGLKGHRGNKIIEISDIRFCQTSSVCVCVCVCVLSTDPHSSPNTMQVIKSGRRRWAENVIIRMRDVRGAYRLWWRDPKERENWKS